MTENALELQDFVTRQPVVTGGVLALGNFDGVHLGHCEVLRTAKAKAQELGLQAHALTFDPHPYAVFKKDGHPFLLTPRTMKHRYLLEAGADRVVTVEFTTAFARKTPEQFMQDVLIDGCRVRHVVVGFDFVFGYGRGGDRAALRKHLMPLGIGVTEVPPCRDADGEVISSSRIRAALKSGDVSLANTLLGRPFSIAGLVQKGAQRGRTIDFPTANIALGEIVRPDYGVYVIKARRVRTPEAPWRDGIANIGVRPSIGDQNELLEFYLFDVNEQMYDEDWEVQLLHFLRAEKAFPDLDALKSQIQIDVAQARQFLCPPSDCAVNG